MRNSLYFILSCMGLSSGFPLSFDTTQQRPNCTLSLRLTSSDCYASWVTVAVDALSFRRCYQSISSASLSPQYLLNCIGGGGCNGGRASSAWNYLTTSGVPTAACTPYIGAQTDCNSTCFHGEVMSLYRAKRYQQYRGVPAIQMAIMQGGPVQACFSVYEDFLSYTNGVYYYQRGSFVQYACVHLIGWSGNAWLAFNNRYKSWGQLGRFSIRMGDSGIEDDVWGGDP